MRLFASIFIIILVSNLAISQDDKGSLNNGKVSGDKIEITKQKVYDPKIASRRSAIIPGWGQIYNDNWWKVPILYAGIGTAIYFVDFNEDRRNTFLALYNEESAQPNPDSNLLRVYSRKADEWRKNRDLVFLTMAGIYALQIIEAAVDAHLKGFNVDENLALNLKPKIGVISSGAPYLGFNISLPIGR